MKIARLSALVVVAAAASMVMMPPAVAAASEGTASAATCWVKNLRTGAAGADLQTAISGAAAGDTLKLAGTCGAFDIGTSLKLLGPATIGRPVCVQCGSGTMGRVQAGATVTLKDLAVTGGFSSWDGGGILNEGTLILNGRTSIKGNQAEDNAAGIDNYGTLVMNDYSAVTGNSLYYRGDGGGIRNHGLLSMNEHSSVTGNSASRGAGVYNSGTLVMGGFSTVSGNSGETGGGIYSTDTGTLVLKDSSKIIQNVASGYYDNETGALISTGGGVFNAGTLRIDSHWCGAVRGNTPDNWDRPAVR